MYGPEIALNAVVIVLLVIFAACWGSRTYEGRPAALTTLFFSVILSFIGWTIFVIAHFVGKYW